MSILRVQEVEKAYKATITALMANGVDPKTVTVEVDKATYLVWGISFLRPNSAVSENTDHAAIVSEMSEGDIIHTFALTVFLRHVLANESLDLATYGLWEMGDAISTAKSGTGVTGWVRANGDKFPPKYAKLIGDIYQGVYRMLPNRGAKKE